MSRLTRNKITTNSASSIKSKINPTFRRLFVLTSLLVILGLVAVADASAPLAISKFNDRFYFVRQQAIWAGFGMVLMVVTSMVNYKFWQKLATPLFLLSVTALLLVFIPGFGTKIMGARRWIDLGFTTFQPAEFVKLAMILFIAKVADRNKKLFSYFVPLGLVSGLIMFQPDLGTTMVIILTTLAQIFVSGINLYLFFGTGVVSSVIVFILIYFSDYRRARLMTFLNSADDPLNKGYHIRQILLALGSGGFFGVGIGASRQKFLFLPETATDSIFAVIAEEVGFFGSVALLSLFVAYLVFGFKIIKAAPDKFSKMLAVGIVSWICIQTFLNVGSMLALVPLTGIPLPFISFGGTALVMMLLATGILLNISKYAKT